MAEQLIICTIVAKNYLAHARVLMQSVAQYQPEAQRVVLLVDEVDGYFDPAQEDFTLLLARDLGIPKWPHVALRYDILELNTAVKPHLLERLFADEWVGKVIYLDPDILLFQPLTVVVNLLDTQMAVLTPHILKPLDDGYYPSELDLLRVGTHNLGFFAISRRGAWHELLRWWQDKLYTQGYNDQFNGMFVDQKWMDFAPSLFEGVAILRDPTYNVAYWNFKQRPLEHIDEVYFIDQQPLTFFHFSGFNTDHLEQLSRHQNRHRLSELPVAFHTIMHTYAEQLQAQGYNTVRSWPYVYDFFSDGVPITRYHRLCLRQHDPNGERWPDPSDYGAPDNFRDWCVQPWGLLSPYTLALHADQAEVQKLFPRIESADEVPFAEWFVAQSETSVLFNSYVTQPIRDALIQRQIAIELQRLLMEREQGLQGVWHYYRDFPQKVQPYLPANALDIRTEIYTGPGGLYGCLRNLLHRIGLLQTLRRLIGLRVIMTARFFFASPAQDPQP